MKNKIIRFLMLTFAWLPMLLSTASAQGVTASENSERHYIPHSGDKVNIYVYMIGSDLESINGQATEDLREMQRGMRKADECITLYLYAGGCTEWQNKYFSADSICCYKVKGDSTQMLYRDEARDMTDPDTLSGFLSRVKEEEAAERNILLFWDHGGGAMGGFGVDTLYPNSAGMSPGELAGAVEESGIPFDLICFDACLMSTMEGALALSGCADYLLASECMTPGVGWRYDQWLPLLSAEPDMPTAELAENIADEYLADCAEHCEGQSVSLTLTDLHILGSELPPALDALGEELVAVIFDKQYRQIAMARLNSAEFGGTSLSDTIDLMQFCEDLPCASAAQVMGAIRNAVCFCRYQETSDIGGLSAFLPFHSFRNTDAYLKVCEEIGISEDYQHFVRAFNAMELCGQLAQRGRLSYFGYLYGEHSNEDVMSETELFLRVDAAIRGTEPLSELDLSDENSGFLRKAFRDRKYLWQACAYVCENSFRPSALRWASSLWGRAVLVGLEEQEKLVGKIYQEVSLELGEQYMNYGWVPVDNNRIVTGQHDNEWYTINGEFCPIYCLDSYTEQGETYFTALIPVIRNGVEGYLTAQVQKSGKAMITGFMVGYTKENFGMWGKTIPVSRFRSTDSLTLRTGMYNLAGEKLEEVDASETMLWGTGLRMEKQKADSANRYYICYRIRDIYDCLYTVEK